MKERIGDALRNAAMRYGAALDLWHKGDLHADDAEPATNDAPVISTEQQKIIISELAKAQYPLEGFLKKAGVGSLDALREERFKSALTHIQTVAQSTGE